MAMVIQTVIQLLTGHHVFNLSIRQKYLMYGILMACVGVVVFLLSWLLPKDDDVHIPRPEISVSERCEPVELKQVSSEA